MEASRLLATQDLEVLSRHDFSSLASLRRCLRLLPVLEAGDPTQAARCFHGLLAYLGAILSRDNPSPSLLPALKVFAEGLVFNGQLRSSFVIIDGAAPERARIFAEALPSRGDYHILLELVYHHFTSSWLDQEGFKAFLSALSCFKGALALFNITRLFFAPAVVQAHLLLLVSRCISDKNLDLNLLAFECAMNLYATYLPARQIDGLFSFCQLHTADDLPIDESDIDCLIEENQHMLHGEVRQQATMDVKHMLPDILLCAKQKEVHEADAEVSDETVWLAAVLRLMGSSLKYMLPHFSQMRSANDKRYNVIHESIRLLGRLEANEFHRYDLPGTIGNPMGRESASMVMLAHFASLSIYCVRRRLRFLWKSCIIMMIMAMNLIHEEESLGTFRFSADVSKESAAFCSSRDGVHKDRNDYGDGSS
uniref:DUF7812 domain-containing protein n=1 Tax=Setaria viridis TaxID=4556 RepID=A0A4U6U700_SETVI|nr:hypothetical protein SEVIR_6G152700v2 [Setaria viridis]